VIVALTHRGPLLLVYALFQQTAQLLDEHMDMSRMAGRSFAVYSVVGVEGPTTPSRLAEILGMPATSLSYTLRRMHEAGHLRRVPNPGDGRSVLVALTARGRRVLDEALAGFAEAITAFRAELDIEEPELLRHLEAMSSALDRAISASQNPDEKTCKFS